jgi:phosphatidylserine decarboxylase
MVRDGIYYGLGFAAAGAIVSRLTSPLTALPLFILATFCLWFFRDPERPIPAGEVAVSPGDGKVVAVVNEPGRTTRISIFLNIFDVHVNRSPISGTLVDITYQKGKFLVASLEDASTANEQNIFTVRAADGTTVIFKQIAGLIARRIVCYKKIGDHVQAGERVGLIKFGSRVDVLLGPEWRVEVTPGMRVSAGSSILARRAGAVELPISLAVKLDAAIQEGALCQT